jgi:quinol-cytochrome oxidoreductase complex cytochrome b subunit
MNKNAVQFFKPVIFLFIIVTILVFIFSNWLDAHEVNHYVLLVANIILLVLICVTGFLHIKAAGNNNPHAFVRSITLSAFLKLIVIAVAIFIYLNSSGENKSIYAVGAAMLLYVIYTVVEVRAAMRLNRKRNVES